MWYNIFHVDSKSLPDMFKVFFDVFYPDYEHEIRKSGAKLGKDKFIYGPAKDGSVIYCTSLLCMEELCLYMTNVGVNYTFVTMRKTE